MKLNKYAKQNGKRRTRRKTEKIIKELQND